MNYARLTLATASSVLLLAALAACGGDPSDSGTDDGSTTQQTGPGGSQPGSGDRLPGASGEVAAVSGSTAQVQSQQSGQVAVTWTGDTTFTEQVDGSLDDVTAGSCVIVATDDETSEDATEVEATTVRVSEPDGDGGCGFGAGGPGGGERPEGAPTDLPSEQPSGAPDDPRRVALGTVGEVTAVSADGFTVSTTMPGSDETTELTVTVDDATTYTTTAPAKAAAVQVGRCVTARGESDDAGAVTAESISVSDAVDGECAGLVLGMRGPEDGAA